MQEQTTKVNLLTIQLNDISDNILSYFESGDEPNSSAERLPSLPPERIHTDQTAIYDQISIALLSDEDDAWNHYVESNPATSIYHKAEWKDLIHNIFGHECYYFYACNNAGETVGILPLVRLKSRLFGDFMTSMPYFNYGGAIANNLSIEQKLMHAANIHAEKLGINHIEYRDDIEREGLPVSTEKVNMILSLPATHNDLWNTFTSKLRSQIRRSRREGAQVTFGGEECLVDFYTVFARNMRDLGTPVYGKLFFSNILRCFEDHSRIVVVSIGNRPVAAAFLLGYNGTLEIPWASTIKDVNHLSMNMLLYWEVLKFAIKNQYQYFDFGRSSKKSGTFRFKQQWGAKPKQLYWHYWLPENAELPRLNPDNPKYAMAISIWKRLPIFITKWIGPLIVRNLP
ncbi:MAG: FemAB family PEP-CTERM system-associated protein [Gammaproteobacteria bacterium]|nr:FemAB family PEP-CTERM system-associated protein [Gammaproteobacteria bacterium]